MKKIVLQIAWKKRFVKFDDREKIKVFVKDWVNFWMVEPQGSWVLTCKKFQWQILANVAKVAFEALLSEKVTIRKINWKFK